MNYARFSFVPNCLTIIRVTFYLYVIIIDFHAAFAPSPDIIAFDNCDSESLHR